MSFGAPSSDARSEAERTYAGTRRTRAAGSGREYVQCPCFHNVSKTGVDSGELAWTGVDDEKDWKAKGIEGLGQKVEQHHQLEKRPSLQFDSRRLHCLTLSNSSRFPLGVAASRARIIEEFEARSPGPAPALALSSSSLETSALTARRRGMTSPRTSRWTLSFATSPHSD
jgi:hypothetical protein